MPVDVEALLDDLEAETTEVTVMLDGLTPEDYERPTPAEGWAVRDQVSHLAYFDETATISAIDPERFRRDADRLMARGTDFADVLAGDYRDLPAAELLAWFRRARQEFVSVYRGLAARQRVPWYGPDMSAASCITARLMETWAHGQDMADALGVDRKPTARLHHIADLGVRTMGFSFALNGRPPPSEPVRVALQAPDGKVWTWAEQAGDSIEGSALDFCLAVTQRRHVDDTDLRMCGEGARAWMSVAQAFAGPPGTGRTSERVTEVT